MPRAAALNLLQGIINAQAADSRIREAMREVWPDIGLIGGYMTNTGVIEATVLLLDEILGEKLASYFLYECNQNGRVKTADGATYPITSVDDIEAYLNAVRPE